jgi:endonuclease/exonuclease/phosphatase family metal-dependent hydrolase
MRYYALRNDFAEKSERARVLANLTHLRETLDGEVPDKDAEHNLLLGTWNIRDLGKRNRRGFGTRLKESHWYIAEVISRFDFVAVQEVNELPEWDRIMYLLGPDWDYMATDVTDTKLGGNGERLTYVFDRRKVSFRNIAGEIVLPADMLISKVVVPDPNDTARKLHAGKQFRRTPYVAAFQSGWFKFDICTVHIYYGKTSGPALEERIEEIERIATYFGKRADEAIKGGRTLILLGDFNIMHPEHETMKKLVGAGFKVPKSLQSPTNAKGNMYYDQIAFQGPDAVVDYVERASASPKSRNAGVFRIFDGAFRSKQFDEYKDAAKKSPNGKKKSGEALRKYYNEWRTYQFSDHNLLWARLDTNDAAEYLERLQAECEE